MMKNKRLLLTLGIYVVLFYASWAFVEMVLIVWMAAIFDKVTMTLMRDALIKNLLWTLPALLLIHAFRGELAVGEKEMWRWKKKDFLILLPLAAFLAAFVLVGSLVRRHGLSISPNFGWDSVIIVLTVGVTEELVFRGWLLNVMAKNADTEGKKLLALLLNAVMFLCIHFPIWITSGVFVSSFRSMGFVTVIVLSMLFGMSFLRTKNLLVPIILHSFYDLLVFMFV